MTLADRYARVNASLPPRVKLIAVSKTRTVAEIQALYDLGHRAFGENYPQELRDKQPLLPADIEWHFIGHLQTNKVKYIAPFVHLVHAVDSERLLDELEKRAAAAGRTIGFLWQAHVARETTKHGLLPDELRATIQRTAGSDRWPHLQARGLMGMSTNTDDHGQVEREFAALEALFLELRGSGHADAARFTELSMGMSSDAQLAIAHGSTMVRIGTALFGERP
ncbi:MAG: YggS family pyridoxal phosphate-dependent enzyme [Bacteroidetes bacterium]|nr:YggS family pyridoxal phosphate-dependent enzyme [Bacteroidota bacterium]